MQKTLPKTHKSIPVFSLHSTHSYQTFFKNNPKHIHKLDLDSNTVSSLKPERTKRVLQNLFKLTKKSPNIKTLHDANLLKSFKAKESQAILVMKKFQRVQALQGLLWDFYEIKTQKEIRKWLKYTKRLQTLVFRHAKYRTRPRPSMILPAKKLNQKLFRDIKQRKIVSFIHSVSPDLPFIPNFKYNKGNHYTLDMRDYPTSIQELSLNLAKSVISLDNNIEKSICTGKFLLLKRLELLFCLDLGMALKILRSIPNPQNINSLGLHLRNRFPEDDEEAMIPIFEFIRNNGVGLEKLDLRITHPTEKLEILGRQNQLKTLNLWIPIKAGRHLKDLGLLISAGKMVENLDLTIDFDVNSILTKENFEEFYKEIGKLRQIKKLCLDFFPSDNPFTRKDYIQLCNYNMPDSLFPVLMESVACLSRLEQLFLRFPGDLKADLLGKALGGVAHQLKKLEVNFYEQALDIEGNLGFPLALRNMKELRELSMVRFSFSQEKKFLEFKEFLKGSENLEKVVLESFEIPLEGDEILIDLVLSLLKKRGLKELRIKHPYQKNVRKGRVNLRFDGILRENPELRIAKIESSHISYNSLSNPFESFKYM